MNQPTEEQQAPGEEQREWWVWDDRKVSRQVLSTTSTLKADGFWTFDGDFYLQEGRELFATPEAAFQAAEEGIRAKIAELQGELAGYASQRQAVLLSTPGFYARPGSAK